MSVSRPPTSTDVARLAGVSQATVSYVLNATAGQKVKGETRAKVFAAAEELGYVPSASARSLRTGTSDIVLMPIPDIPFGGLYMSFMNVLNQRLRALGYDAVMYGAASPGRDWAKWRPAAVLADGSLLTDDVARRLKAAGVKTVVALGHTECTTVPVFALDDRDIGDLAAAHLLSRGCETLAYVAPGLDALGRFAHPRLDGFRSRAGDAALTTHVLPFEGEAAAALAAQWRTGPHPDGVFAYNDEYAMLIMRALQDEGFDIPKDIAVVGADDLPLCTLLRPRLTTIAPVGELTGADVADRIHALIQGEPWRPLTAEFRLIERESS